MLSLIDSGENCFSIEQVAVTSNIVVGFGFAVVKFRHSEGPPKSTPKIPQKNLSSSRRSDPVVAICHYCDVI